MRMAAFWTECEVSLPNKLVAVPRENLLFRDSWNGEGQKKLNLYCVKSTNTDSTSTGSGSHRSECEEEKESLKLLATIKTTADIRDPRCDCGDVKPPAPKFVAAFEAF